MPSNAIITCGRANLIFDEPWRGGDFTEWKSIARAIMKPLVVQVGSTDTREMNVNLVPYQPHYHID